NSIVDNIDKILEDNSVTAENFVTKLLGLRQFNQTHPTWMALGVEYFRQYEENNTPEQHKTFFRELEVVMVYFLLARPFCLNKEITEFIKKWVQKLRQNQIIVDPSSGDDMDLDQITFQPSAREAIYKCDVYNYPDISKFVLAKINGKLADPYVNVLYPEIDITLSISVLNQQHSPEECPLGVLVPQVGITLSLKNTCTESVILYCSQGPPTVRSGKNNTIKNMTDIGIPVLRLRNILPKTFPYHSRQKMWKRGTHSLSILL
ncbi:2587_t:CDS:2, partial [Gigaspora rosea]